MGRGWLRDAEDGRQAEEYVVALLRRGGLAPRRNEAPTAGRLGTHDWAFDLDGAPATVEVKFDRAEARTGNVAVEYGRPSGAPGGLSATTATYWVYVLRRPLVAYVCSTAALRRFVAGVAPARSLVGVGDGNACVHLYPADEIIPALFYSLDAPDVCEVLRHVGRSDGRNER